MADMPQKAEDFNKLAWKSAQSGNYSKALELISLALKSCPDDWSYMTSKGYFLRQLKLFDEAEVLLRNTISDSHGSANFFAWTELGLLYRDTEEFERAAVCFLESLKQHNDVNVYTLLASVQMQFDQVAALASVEEALAIEPSWEEAIQIRQNALAFIRQVNE